MSTMNLTTMQSAIILPTVISTTNERSKIVISAIIGNCARAYCLFNWISSFVLETKINIECTRPNDRTERF